MKRNPNRLNRWKDSTPEERSAFAKSGAQARLAKMTKEDRIKHAKMMATSERKKRHG